MLEQATELASFSPDASGRLVAGPGKYEGLRPFEVWLFDRCASDSSYPDAETGSSTEWEAWYALAGRWIVAEDDRGFAYADRFASPQLARDAFSEIEARYSELETDEENESETSFSEEWHAAYRHARYVRDTDTTTAESFADFVDEHSELIDHEAAEIGESPYADAWIAFLRDRTPRGSNGNRD